METVVISGGTGMIGTALTRVLLEKGYQVIILTRDPPANVRQCGDDEPRVEYARWDIKEKTIDPGVIARADHIIHLAGAGVAEKRWTQKRKREIVSSRVTSGKRIADSLLNFPNKVKTVVSASAIGWYGPAKGHRFTETDPPANDFLGQACKLWEESTAPVTSVGKRLVKLRTGIVLSNKGGALKEFLFPLKFGVASILGNGKQVISWIHIEDLVNMYIAAIENSALSGVYNAVAPSPVTNKEFVLQLARTKGYRFFIPLHVPAFVLKILLGEMSIEVLKSADVSSDKIQQAGFVFKFPSLSTALQDLLNSEPGARNI